MYGMPQRDTFLLMGLHRKRSRLAGEIEAAELAIGKQREALAQIDAVIRLFEPQTNPELIPSRRPTPRGLYFRHGEQRRLCLAALREAAKPLTAPQIAEYAMFAKELPIENRALRAKIIQQIRVALARPAKRGMARKIVERPDTW